MKNFVSRSLSLGLLLLVLTLGMGVQSFAYEGVPNWFRLGLAQADALSIVPESFNDLALDQTITRDEFAEIIVRAYFEADGVLPKYDGSKTFSDGPGPYADTAYALGFVSGYPDGTFRPEEQIKREELFVMIHKFLSALENQEENTGNTQQLKEAFQDADALSPWAVESALVVYTRQVVSGTGAGKLAPKASTSRAEALQLVINGLDSLSDFSIEGLVDEKALALETTSLPVTSRGAFSRDSRINLNDPVHQLGTNAAKYALIFGDTDTARYQTAAEAQRHMVSVSVDVWQLNGAGEKVAAKRSVTINRAIAPFVAAIFKEIFEGPEKFPIKSMGGYAWRSNTRSEHRWGLAIDINPVENYMIRSDGTVVSGSFWKPGTNPYSIRPDGDVVRAFKKYGFAWGGDAWPSSKDYMHFSYLGK